MAFNNDDPVKLTPGADRYFHYILRGLQIIVAVPVLGIYGAGLAKPADQRPSGFDVPKWVWKRACRDSSF